MDKEFSKAVIRLVVTAFLLINALLTAKGVNPIPLDESQVTDIASQVAAVAACVWVWWKNNLPRPTIFLHSLSLFSGFFPKFVLSCFQDI